MSRSHYHEICRGLYAEARKAGSPAVYVIDLGCGQMVAETADGELLDENASGCCKWAVKYVTACQWLKEHGVKEYQGD